jgi:hypothetical protein
MDRSRSRRSRLSGSEILRRIAPMCEARSPAAGRLRGSEQKKAITVSVPESGKFERTSSHGSPEELNVVLYTFLEDINVEDVEFRENPNAVFVATFHEYYLSHSPVSALRWLVAELDKFDVDSVVMAWAQFLISSSGSMPSERMLYALCNSQCMSD